MIVLDAVTKSLQVILGGAITTNQLTIVASFVDTLTTTMELTGIGENDLLTNNGTAVVAVAAPAANTSRQVKSLTVQNTDTAAAAVTVRVNNNGTFRPQVVITLAAGSTLFYEDGYGWRVVTTAGASL